MIVEYRSANAHFEEDVPMGSFSMTCTCGHVMKTDASTKEEAVRKIKAMMSPGAIAQHMAERHPGQPVLPVAQVHAMIEQGVRPA